MNNARQNLICILQNAHAGELAAARTRVPASSIGIPISRRPSREHTSCHIRSRSTSRARKRAMNRSETRSPAAKLSSRSSMATSPPYKIQRTNRRRRVSNSPPIPASKPYRHSWSSALPLSQPTASSSRASRRTTRSGSIPATRSSAAWSPRTGGSFG